MVSAADTTQRMRAFEIAHENMETIISSDSVEEMSEFGISEKFPDIRWQTTVESFYEPSSSRMWVRAVCSAEYTNTAGETKNVELTHWLTDLTDEQMQKLMERDELLKQKLAQYIVDTEDLAAEYAGVDVETIQAWVRNGMPTSADGGYLKPWLDLYLRTDGRPTAQEKQDTLLKYPDLPVSSGKQDSQNAFKTPETETGTDGMGTEPDMEETTDMDTPSGPDEFELPDDLDPELRQQLEEALRSRNR
jgi:hypothetical protein